MKKSKFRFYWGDNVFGWWKVYAIVYDYKIFLGLSIAKGDRK